MENEMKAKETPDQMPEQKGQTQQTAEETVSDIRRLFEDQGADIPADEIAGRLRDLTDVYGVPAGEARRCVINALSKKYGVEKPPYQGRYDEKPVTVGSILAAGREEESEEDIQGISGRTDDGSRRWATVSVRVIRLWGNNHERIAQAGLAGDETGVVKFVSWKNAGLPPLEENESYTLKNVVISRWNGKVQIELNKASSVSEAGRPVQTPDQSGAQIENGDWQNEMRKVAGLNKEGMWTDVKVRILRLWEETHESIRQAGLAGDETGLIKFTVWQTAGCPPMAEGKCYLIRNAVVKEMNGRFSADLNKVSAVEEIDENIVIHFEKTMYVGCAVDVQAGSGLIRRCSACRKVISKGLCPDHGKVTGENDLRIKAVIDNGKTAQEVIIGRELTEQILGLTLDEAVLAAAETLDPEVICDRIRNAFIGKYWKITGGKTDRYLIADEAAETIPSGDLNALRTMIENESGDSRMPGMPEAV